MPSSPHAETRLRGRRCLVTGATGFVGRRLVPRLIDAGMRVTAQVRAPESTVTGTDTQVGDMTRPEWSQSAHLEWRWDDVVHLAGPVAGSVECNAEQMGVARAHPRIAQALLLALPSGWRGRLIHASSMTVYGAAPALPVSEQQPLSPTFPYALGKVLAEDVLGAAGLPDFWMLRLPGLFAAERQSGALYHFIKAGLDRRTITLSAREPTLWDLLHADDAVEAIVRALASLEPFQGPMNVSYGETVSLERIAQRVAALTTGVDVVNETAVVHPDFQLDITRAQQRLGWPPCNLESRIEQMIAGMRHARV